MRLIHYNITKEASQPERIQHHLWKIKNIQHQKDLHLRNASGKNSRFYMVTLFFNCHYPSVHVYWKQHLE